MSLDCPLKAFEPLQTIIVDKAKDYVTYIQDYKKNMKELRDQLDLLYNIKIGIDRKVRTGKNNFHRITEEGVNWLKKVRKLTEAEELKKLMAIDMEIARLGLLLTEWKVMKNRLKEDKEMQGLVAELINRFEGDDVADITVVVGEVMKDTTEKFKKLIKDNSKMAVAAIDSLEREDVDILKNNDEEMATMLNRAEKLNREEFVKNYLDDDREGNIKGNEEPSDAHTLTEAVAKLLEPLGRLYKDENLLNKVFGERGAVKLELKIMRTLSNNKESKFELQHTTSTLLCDYHHRYGYSKDAKEIAKDIQEHIIKSCPEKMTVPKSLDELKSIPTEFVISRSNLLNDILAKLKDDKFNVLGLHGMGGIGKTTLAKEVSNNNSVKYMFNKIVMVEISIAPNIESIQNQIAEVLGVNLNDVHTLPHKAMKLYNSLIFAPTTKEGRGEKEGEGKKEGEGDKGKKVLIILDNIWKKLNLDDLGIPHPHTKEYRCKLLLTSRMKDVCKEMGVDDKHAMIGIDNLSESEARDLFKKHIGPDSNIDTDNEYKSMADKILGKCGGLPLAITSAASSLKGRNLSFWQYFIKEMEKPVSSQARDFHLQTNLVLETSFKLMEDQDKRRFLLLACLFPPGTSIPIRDLLRYGIGLDLFQNVNNLTEAMQLAKKWADDLISSSLLLKDGEDEDFVKIHDTVRESAISFATTVEYKMMVEAIPQWLREETFGQYAAISVMVGCETYRLNKIKSEKLEILVLNDNNLSELPDTFFEGMTKLKILAMSKMNFEKHLPTSMRALKTLRTLHLQECMLGDIGLIGELVNLLILSLRGSDLKKLPEEIWKLRDLCVLDLTGCKLTTIPAYVIASLSQLGGIYMRNSFKNWAGEENTNQGASICELARFNCVNVLEMDIQKMSQLPRWDDQFVRNLDEFCISIGGSIEDSGQYKRVLMFEDFDQDKIVNYICLKRLLEKVECLYLIEGRGLKHFIPGLDMDVKYLDLKSLQFQGCNEMEYLVSAESNKPVIHSWKLESIRLRYLGALKMICDDFKCFPSLFSSLQRISLMTLPGLKSYVLPIGSATNLTEIDVWGCENLEFILMEHNNSSLSNDGEGTHHPSKLLHLKELRLSYMPQLKSLLGEVASSSSQNQPQNCQCLFNKIIFQSLETVELYSLHNIRSLDYSYEKGMQPPWYEDYISGFRKLKVLDINNCNEMEYLCSVSVATALEALETLSIENCGKMRKVINSNNEGIHIDIVFPNLKDLTIGNAKELTSFCQGSCRLQFPSLQRISLFGVGSLAKISGRRDSVAFFDQTVTFSFHDDIFSYNFLYILSCCYILF